MLCQIAKIFAHIEYFPKYNRWKHNFENNDFAHTNIDIFFEIARHFRLPGVLDEQTHNTLLW